MNGRIACVGLLVALSVGSSTRAGWTGHTVTADWLYPIESLVLETHQVVVGPGVELRADQIRNDESFDIDVDDTTVTFDFHGNTFWQSTDANGWRFTDTNGTLPDIVGYSIAAVSPGVLGLEESDLSFGPDFAYGNFRDILTSGPDDFIVLNVHFVPEPAGWLLGIAALLSVVAIAQRQKRT
jgi:hypothetical protein